jgi:hypothetical protein
MNCIFRAETSCTRASSTIRARASPANPFANQLAFSGSTAIRREHVWGRFWNLWSTEAGGETGIRTLEPLDRSVSYRGFVAPGAIFAIRPDAHYPKLPKSGNSADGNAQLCSSDSAPPSSLPVRRRQSGENQEKQARCEAAIAPDAEATADIVPVIQRCSCGLRFFPTNCNFLRCVLRRQHLARFEVNGGNGIVAYECVEFLIDT